MLHRVQGELRMKQMKSDLKTSDPVDTFFALSSADLRSAKNRKAYLAVNLSDKSGQINGYVWNSPEDTAACLSGITYVHVKGTAKTYNGALNIHIESIRPAADEEIDIADFLQVVPGGIEFWEQRLYDHIELVRDSSCDRLICSFISDVQFFEAFKLSSAGLTVHHNYTGGLLEHTANTMSHAVHMADHYPEILDRDLLLTGSLLHDIGKVRAITGGVTKAYTTEGKLMGHISIGLIMLEEKLSRIKEISAETGLLLKHMILAHHGSLEFGSPVKPATPEALALHHIENTDAKMNHIYGLFRDSDPEREWSSYDKYFATEIYQGKSLKETTDQVREMAALTGALSLF